MQQTRVEATTKRQSKELQRSDKHFRDPRALLQKASTGLTVLQSFSSVASAHDIFRPWFR